MILHLSAPRLLAAFVVAIATIASAQRGQSDEPVETALAVSPDSPNRLVLAYWPSSGWQVRQSGRQVELVLPGAGLAISAAAVALPTGGGAITTLTTEIDQAATYLRIGLACDCTLAVQGDGARLLIDVVGAERIAGPMFRGAGPAPRLSPAPAPRHAGAAVAMRPVTEQRAEETRARLLEELRGAAEAGLVTLRPDADGVLAQANNQPAEPEIQIQTEPEVAIEALPVGAPATVDGDGYPGASIALAAAPEVPVLAGTAAPGQPTGSPPLPAAVPPLGGEPPAELAPQVSSHDLLVVVATPVCFENEAFRLTDPLPHNALTAEIARLRSTLLSEFDRAELSSALSLARLYLAHGLGVEAASILAEFAPDAPETGLLAALAWLTEGKPLPVPNVLSASGCTGQHALWQAFDAALKDESGKALEYEVAAAGALEQMARGVRGQIAVRLGMVAIAERNWVAAHRLNAMAKRSIAGGDRDDQEMRRLLEAKLSIGRGDMATGLARLKELRDARSLAGTEALLMLAQLTTDPANETGVRPDRLRIDLGALAMAQRDTQTGEQAFLGEVDLTGHLFGRDAAFELLAYGFAGRVISKEVYRDALAAVGASLAESQNDRPLALAYEADPQRFAKALENHGFRLALARSYVGLGVPSLAEALLRPGDIQGDALLGDLARAYLEINDSEAAERFALELPAGPGQSMIQAGVALAAGDAAEALVALNAAGAPASERARTAWAAGDWRESARAWAEVISARASATGHAPVDTAAPESGAAQQSADLVIRLALAARRAGFGAVPPEAASLVAGLPGLGPDLGPGLEAIFVPLAQDLAGFSPTDVAAYLETVSAEARLFEELLEDG